MQVNSRWLGTLSSFGIGRDQLFDPCINTYVGAWILAQNISRLGYGWDAIGAYNARSPEKRAAYARRIATKVAEHLHDLILKHLVVLLLVTSIFRVAQACARQIRHRRRTKASPGLNASSRPVLIKTARRLRARRWR